MSVETVIEALRSRIPFLNADRPWYTKLGAGVTEEKLQALINAGYGVVINGGVQSTPITGAGVYVSTTPDMDIQVDADKAFIPLVIDVVYEAVGLTGIQEVFATAGLGGTFATGGTALTYGDGIRNLNSGYAAQTGLTVRSPASVAVLPTERFGEIWRASVPQGITKTAQSATVSSNDQAKFTYRAKEEGIYHTLRAGNNLRARMNIWMGGQAPTGFIMVKGVLVPVGWTED